MIFYMPGDKVDASIIVPTYREAPNLPHLFDRLFSALQKAQIDAEVIIVDDNSRDGTVEIVGDHAEQFPVKVLVRTGERGLSSAVLAGFEEAHADRLVVMDADLQHPPESVPDLIGKLDDPRCDFVIGTRYAGSGGVEDDWPFVRRVVSRVATLMAKPLVPLSDPMSGFFALRREVWQRAQSLDPIGYKIALELYVKGRCRHPVEVPIRLAARVAGETKLSLRVQIRYIRHLWRLYRFRFPRGTIVVIVLTVALALAVVWRLWAAAGR